MAIFAIGDLHLSLSCQKQMDVFAGWDNYVERIAESWQSLVAEGDTVVLAGDISWGMTLEQSLADFKFIDSLPGKKVIIKGNHDYWWGSRRKMEDFFAANGLESLEILHNSCVACEGVALCGTRGWMLEEGTEQDKKVTAREEGRLLTSLQEAKKLELEPIVFLHYPPLFADGISAGIIDLLREYKVKRCYYGHLHAAACRLAFEGEYLGINFELISADHLKFCLRAIK